MKKISLLAAAALSLAPSFALAKRGNEPPHNPPPLEKHGRAIVNASCVFGPTTVNGLVSCTAGPLVAIPANPPAWLTSACFFLTDFTASNYGAGGGDVIALNDGKSPATTKVVYTVAQGATVTQSFQDRKSVV
jgi:hypothetical protein